jgi:hypothetical protein
MTGEKGRDGTLSRGLQGIEEGTDPRNFNGSKGESHNGKVEKGMPVEATEVQVGRDQKHCLGDDAPLDPKTKLKLKFMIEELAKTGV